MGSKGQQPLFQPFRALGYITDDVPFAVQRRGKETYVTVSVGKAWQVGGAAGAGRRVSGCSRRSSMPCWGTCWLCSFADAFLISTLAYRAGV